MGHGAWGRGRKLAVDDQFNGSPESTVLSQTYASNEMLAELGFPMPHALIPGFPPQIRESQFNGWLFHLGSASYGCPWSC